MRDRESFAKSPQSRAHGAPMHAVSNTHAKANRGDRTSGRLLPGAPGTARRRPLALLTLRRRRRRLPPLGGGALAARSVALGVEIVDVVLKAPLVQVEEALREESTGACMAAQRETDQPSPEQLCGFSQDRTAAPAGLQGAIDAASERRADSTFSFPVRALSALAECGSPASATAANSGRSAGASESSARERSGLRASALGSSAAEGSYS